jgi:ankyrin repeat protein
LHEAVKHDQSLEIVQALLEAGADATVEDKDGRNPLHLAAGSESWDAPEVVDELIEAGADATAQDEDGRNPLHFAAGSKSSKVLEVV